MKSRSKNQKKELMQVPIFVESTGIVRVLLGIKLKMNNGSTVKVDLNSNVQVIAFHKDMEQAPISLMQLNLN